MVNLYWRFDRERAKGRTEQRRIRFRERRAGGSSLQRMRRASQGGGFGRAAGRGRIAEAGGRAGRSRCSAQGGCDQSRCPRLEASKAETSPDKTPKAGRAARARQGHDHVTGDRAWDSTATAGRIRARFRKCPASAVSARWRPWWCWRRWRERSAARWRPRGLGAFRWRRWSGRRQSRARSLRRADRRRHRGAEGQRRTYLQSSA